MSTDQGTPGHISDEDLFDLVRASLDAARREALTSHLDSCTECMEIYQQALADHALVQGAIATEHIEIPAGTAALLAQTMARERRSEKAATARPKMPRWRFALNVGLAAALAVGAGLAISSLGGSDSKQAVSIGETSGRDVGWVEGRKQGRTESAFLDKHSESAPTSGTRSSSSSAQESAGGTAADSAGESPKTLTSDNPTYQADEPDTPVTSSGVVGTGSNVGAEVQFDCQDSLTRVAYTYNFTFKIVFVLNKPEYYDQSKIIKIPPNVTCSNHSTEYPFIFRH